MSKKFAARELAPFSPLEANSNDGKIAIEKGLDVFSENPHRNSRGAHPLRRHSSRR
jgi:hypothetical protein